MFNGHMNSNRYVDIKNNSYEAAIFYKYALFLSMWCTLVYTIPNVAIPIKSPILSVIMYVTRFELATFWK